MAEHGTSSVSFIPVGIDSLPEVWEEYSRGHISMCIPYQSGYTLEDVYNHVKDGPLTLWLVVRDHPIASFTTCINTYPQERVLECVHLGGSGIDSWGEQMASLLNEVGKYNECSSVVSVGRKGTEKLYKQWGFDLEAVKLRRRVI